uniref:Uncharacterized protein n=1 Tax=Aegilops tauschii TaxID=37682 RepID=M8D9P8_AEGTA
MEACLKEEMLELTAPSAELKLSDQRTYNTQKSYSRSNGRFDSGSAKGHGTTKLAQFVSRKTVRAFIQCGAGCLTVYPTQGNLPLDFDPKRDFRYSKKVVPQQISIKSNIPDYQRNNKHVRSNVDE